MRSFFSHAVACSWNIHYVFGLRALCIRDPIFTRAAIRALDKIAGFCLGMTGIFQSMRSVRNPNFINIEREIVAFAKMYHAFVRTSPVAAEISLVLVMPDE